jgi:hypothetical protein
MALKKDIRSKGIDFSYHRISSITSVVNHNISIALVSYPDEISRQEAKTDDDVIKIITNYNFPYQDGITTKQAYELLKTLPAFEGAEDV